MQQHWRLLLDSEAGGAWNMRVDAALLASAQQGGAPTLRLYTWNRPCLSLGYVQDCSRERSAACQRAGVDIVRRVTGGGAVLHGGDLTYTIAAPETALPAGLIASYALVERVLRAVLAELGVRCDVSFPRTARNRAFDCFSDRSHDALCVHGRKLCGSAQRRCGGGVLQHGSLRLFPDAAVCADAAGVDPEAATSLRQLGVECSHAEISARLVVAFTHVVGVVCEPGELSAEESAAASQPPIAHSSLAAFSAV